MENICCVEIITAATAILGVCFSSISLWQNYQLNKKQRKDSLNGKLNHLLEYAIQYPELESQVFIDKWVEMKDKNIEAYKPKEVIIHIPMPKPVLKKKKLFTFLDEEEEVPEN